MKLNPDFDYRTVCGEHMLLPMGDNNVDDSCVIHLNETAAYLWQELSKEEGRDFEVNDMVTLLLQEYEVAEDVALADCQQLAADWLKNHIAA